MRKIDTIINTLDTEIEKAEKELLKRQLKADISGDDFKEIFCKCGEIILLEFGKKEKFEVFHKEIVNQLYYYLVGSEKFNGDLGKGILLSGSIGVGKTILMATFCKTAGIITNRVIENYNANRLQSMLIKDKMLIEGLTKRIINIDDFGRESKEINNFGTIERPIVDLLCRRYDKGAVTLATGNHNKETLKDFYGGYVFDRFLQMFNFIEITGKSKRK